MSIIDLAGAEDVTAIATLLDIQFEIRTAEATALRDLMQVLSHEIINALTPVAPLASTAVNLLREGKPFAIASAHGAIEILGRRAEGLCRFVFVDAYQILACPPPSLRPESIGGLLDEAAQLFRGRWASSSVRLTLRKPDPDMIVTMDMDQMIHALINLFSNAADAALGGCQHPPLVVLSTHQRESGVTIVIEATAPESRRKIASGFSSLFLRPIRQDWRRPELRSPCRARPRRRPCFRAKIPYRWGDLRTELLKDSVLIQRS